MSTTTVIADPVTEVLDQLQAALDAVGEMPFARLRAAGQVDAAERYESLMRTGYYRGLSMVRDMDASGAAGVVGAPSVASLLQYRMRLSASEANARVRAAKALCEGRSLANEPIPAPLPTVAHAAETGDVGAAHVGVIVRTMNDLPEEIDPGLRGSVEESMVDFARQFDPVKLNKLGREITLRISPKDPDPEKTAARRGLLFHDDLPGLVAFQGRCTSQTAATIQAALDPLAKPRPEVEGIKDSRTHPQRMMDAFEEIAAQALRHGDLPSQGGEKPHVSVGLTPAQVKTGVVHLPWVGPVPLNTADWMLCDATVTFIELDENGVPIKISKPQRTIPAWQRRTVFERDKGCTFPGCDRPTGWSDIHHVTPWEGDQEHQIDNLVTLCGFHHKLVHQQKWHIEFINRIPHYRPPRWIDPDQTPRRNYIHDTARNQPLRTS